ncbi:MAG: AIR synthase related protein, partial [Bacteroidota bacterium]|nr:AIR synthase related protein [Bacteroidota bacterium]
VEKVFQKWDLNCAMIGVVTDTKRIKFFVGDDMVADVPAFDLVLGGGAPVYHRDHKEPAYYAESKKFKIESVEVPKDLVEVSKFLISHPNIASKQWVYNQYDSMVGTVNMSTNAPSDAAIINIKGTKKAIALKVDCNARYVNADPEIGCAIAVSEAARNIVCSGGEPSAITNCLNFGNPYNPEVYWQFVNTIKGMGAACIKFQTPVTGGNVSFYNQSSYEGPVFPTPTIGMLGVLEDKTNRMTLNFKNEGDSIYLIGSSKDDISSSEYLYSYHKIKNTPPPAFNLDEEYEVQKAVKTIIKERVIQSAHDCADGGLFITLLESAMTNGLGFDISSDEEIRKDAFLFGEAQSRVIVSVKKSDEDKFIDLMMASRAEFEYLGDVTGKEMIIDEKSFGTVAEAKELFDSALGKLLS